MQTESTSCNLNFVLTLRPYRSYKIDFVDFILTHLLNRLDLHTNTKTLMIAIDPLIHARPPSPSL